VELQTVRRVPLRPKNSVDDRLLLVDSHQEET
jgi:hypothetical protein